MLAMLVVSAGASRAEEGLVAHYTFEEGPGGVVRDWSGSGNDGENKGARYVQVDGGWCLAFETGEAYVDCGSGAILDLTEALTLELWLLPQTAFKKGEPGIVGKRIESFTLALGSTGTCWAYLTADGGKGRTDARLHVDGDSWIHIAATFDGKELKIYGNGELQDSTAAVAARLKSGGNFYLRYPVVWGKKVEPAFKCTMDDVRVYERALSAGEVFAHYKEGAAGKGKDVSGFGKIVLYPHVYPEASTLLIEADHSGLAPVRPGTKILMELWDAKANKVVERTSIDPNAPKEVLEYAHTTSVCPVSAVSADGKGEWELLIADPWVADYEVRAWAEDGKGNRIGSPASVAVAAPSRPARIKGSPDVKILNNLVTELLKIDSFAADAPTRYTVVCPRDGWVFIASDAGSGVRVSVDGEEVIVHETGGDREAMRFLSQGSHEIELSRPEGVKIDGLVVRSIPEMIFDSIGYRPAPWVKCYGPYNWDFFKETGVLDTVNVIAERSKLAENRDYMREWKETGKKIVSATFIDSSRLKGDRFTLENTYAFVAGIDGFQRADRDGTLMSEFDGSGYPHGVESYLLLAEVARRISGEAKFAGKVWDCYGKFMYYTDETMAFMKALFDGGHKFAEEIYMQEQPTEKGARQYLEAMMRQRMLRYQRALPGCQKGMIATLAYFSIPCETVNVDPNADYRVFMDMQMNLLANDPVFSELYGVMWYHSSYADEESHRWAARLLRHYCIEGRREMLSKDPYELRHIRNADFREGAAGWTLEPAEEGSIAAKHVRGFGGRQGRYPRAVMGDWCLLTRRSGKKANRFSQKITKLTPGRLYSVKMFTADYEDITKGRNTKQRHAASIMVDGAEVLSDRSICELFTRRGGSYAKEDRKANRWITYRVEFFRAKKKDAMLIISDWSSEGEAGGPEGQELIHNFVEVEPCLEE